MAILRASAGLFVLVLISSVLGLRMPKEECARFAEDKAKADELVKAASELRFELRKKSAPHQCQTFTSRVIESALATNFIRAELGDRVAQYKQIVGMIEARADCFEQSSQMAGGGLRSLLVFMNNCAAEIESGSATSGVDRLQSANRELKEELAGKEALIQQVVAAVDEIASTLDAGHVGSDRPVLEKLGALGEQAKLMRQLVGGLTSATDDQRRAKEEAQERARQSRDRVARLESELARLQREKADCQRVAEDNWNQLRLCRDFGGLHMRR